MDIEELKFKYKNNVLWKRLLLVTGITFLPMGFSFYEEYERLTESLISATDMKEIAQRKIDKAQKQVNKLTSMEEIFESTMLQMQKAEKKLPNAFFMHEILKETAKEAKESNIELTSFDPGNPIISETAFKYMRLPIQIQLFGTYNQIAFFFDRIAHQELTIHIENYQFKLDKIKTASSGNSSVELTMEQQQKRARANSRISASATLIIFRSLTSEEVEKIDSGPSKKTRDKKSKNGSRSRKRRNKVSILPTQNKEKLL